MKKIFFFLLLNANLASAQANLDLGLKAYYPFNGNANDASGNRNDAAHNNASLTTDRSGNPRSAYHFNGRNTYIRVPNSSSLNMGNRMSISLWVKPMKYYTGRCYNNMLIMKGDRDYQPGNYFIRFSDVYTGCTDPTTKSERFYGQAALAPNPLVQLDQWYHVVWTSDGTTARLYVNCRLMISGPLGSLKFTNDDDLFIGRMNDGQYPYWLAGDLDEIRVYNRALSAAEITALCDTKPTLPLIAEVKPPVVKKEKKHVQADTKKIADTAKTFSDLERLEEINNLNAGNSVINTQPEEKLQPRLKAVMKEIMVEHDSITVTLYDNGEIDGDSITLIYNDSIMAKHRLLTDKPLTFVIKIAAGSSRNELIMYAENLGSIPPNTALMLIYDGDKRYEVSMRSNMSTSGAVSFKLRE